MNNFQTIQAALAANFVRSEQLARIIALALESGKNILLWGPGGHGKSEMVAEGLSAVGVTDPFVQSFGEGMDEATLWGGLDFAALESEKVLRYYPENSFLASKYAVFEELFDAPASVLLALKDTLTARVLRKGSQRFAMRTKVIIAITNKDPEEVSDLGPAAAALVERFPLQLKVDWPSYSAADYATLFHKVAPRLPGADLNGTSPILSEVMAKAGETGGVISPRTAVHALGVVKAAAAIRGSARVEREDLLDLAFLPGMEEFASTLREELDAAFERAAAEGNLVAAERTLRGLIAELESADTPIKALQSAKRFARFGDEVAGLKVTDGLTERRKQLRDTVGAKILEAQELALKNTRI